jgi:hypothetical protein
MREIVHLDAPVGNHHRLHHEFIFVTIFFNNIVFNNDIHGGNREHQWSAKRLRL